MTQGDPRAVFAEARAAVERKDWETLQDPVQEGKTARAVRKIGADWEGRIEFAQKRGTWYIRLPEVRG